MRSWNVTENVVVSVNANWREWYVGAVDGRELFGDASAWSLSLGPIALDFYRSGDSRN